MLRSSGRWGTPQALIARAVLAVVLVSFLSSVLSMQEAASRLLFAYARDEMIVATRFLSTLASRSHVPANALLIVGIFSVSIALLGLWMKNAVAIISSVAAAGI